jgi:hypothetical protein
MIVVHADIPIMTKYKIVSTIFFFEIFNSQKSDQISHKGKKFQIFFAHGFHEGLAKNIFVLSYVAFSQIWLNLTTDDCHLGYITKLRGKKKSLIIIINVHQSVHHPSIGSPSINQSIIIWIHQ